MTGCFQTTASESSEPIAFLLQHRQPFIVILDSSFPSEPAHSSHWGNKLLLVQKCPQSSQMSSTTMLQCSGLHVGTRAVSLSYHPEQRAGDLQTGEYSYINNYILWPVASPKSFSRDSRSDNLDKDLVPASRQTTLDLRNRLMLKPRRILQQFGDVKDFVE